MTWPPSTASELKRMLADDLIDETHHVDFKLKVGDDKGSRKNLAANLASFATDGGWIVLGVDEKKGEAPQFVPEPTPLVDQRERIDSIAHMLIDPPLRVAVQELPDDEIDGHGYLLVRVPKSPHVLHAVGGRYHGRRDSTKAVLEDGDVQRLMRLRDGYQTSIETTLEVELSHCPSVNADEYWQMLVRVEPRSPHPWPLREFLTDGNQSHLQREAAEAVKAASRAIQNVRTAPVTELLPTFWVRRPRGVAAVSPGIGRTRQIETRDRARYLELTVADDGTVQVWYAERHVHEDERYAGGVGDSEIVGITASAIALAGRLGTVMGFDGQWQAGVRVDGSYGLSPRSASGGMVRMTNDPYPDVRPYLASTHFETEQAQQDPAGLTNELVLPYLRTVRTESLFGRREAG